MSSEILFGVIWIYSGLFGFIYLNLFGLISLFIDLLRYNKSTSSAVVNLPKFYHLIKVVHI